jgi:succinate-semialdehyde dehydrogenase/glutarate-semialdehyde dehydrogenase
MTLLLQDPSLLKNQAYIDGQWCDAPQQKRFPVNNPATGEVLTHIADLGAVDTTRAIAAADTAMRRWRQRPAKERSQLLRRWFDLVMASHSRNLKGVVYVSCNLSHH